MLSIRNYTRVEIFLPLTTITLPKSRGIIATLNKKFGGITHTKIKYPSDFVGWYIGKKKGRKKVYQEHIIWLMVDVDIEKHPGVEDYFLSFKSAKETEFGEDKVWIICYPVSRFVQEKKKKKKVPK